MLAVYDDPSNQHSIVILPRVAASQLDLTVQREKMVLGKDLLDATLFVTVLECLASSAVCYCAMKPSGHFLGQ
jgi:hypothetical protein